jgi:uncharacterized protein (DUF3820 family)
VNKTGAVECGRVETKKGNEKGKENSHHVFKFGKYRGRSYQDILETDKRYLLWCFENIKGFPLELEKSGVKLP